MGDRSDETILTGHSPSTKLEGKNLERVADKDGNNILLKNIFLPLFSTIKHSFPNEQGTAHWEILQTRHDFWEMFYLFSALAE